MAPPPPFDAPAAPFDAPASAYEAPSPEPGPSYMTPPPPYEAPAAQAYEAPAAQAYEAPYAQPASPFAPPDPAPPMPSPSPMTADGLVRRVPGASLAPSLRKTPTGDNGAPTAAGGTTPADWRPGPQAGSMLSRFQANQRAGRAAAAASPPVDIETHPGEDGP
jgi:hypothetical protein